MLRRGDGSGREVHSLTPGRGAADGIGGGVLAGPQFSKPVIFRGLT